MVTRWSLDYAKTSPTSRDMLLELAHLGGRCLLGMPAPRTVFLPSVTPLGWCQEVDVRVLCTPITLHPSIWL